MSLMSDSWCCSTTFISVIPLTKYNPFSITVRRFLACHKTARKPQQHLYGIYKWSSHLLVCIRSWVRNYLLLLMHELLLVCQVLVICQQLAVRLWLV